MGEVPLYSQVDSLSLRHKAVNFCCGESPETEHIRVSRAKWCRDSGAGVARPSREGIHVGHVDFDPGSTHFPRSF